MQRSNLTSDLKAMRTGKGLSQERFTDSFAVVAALGAATLREGYEAFLALVKAQTGVDWDALHNAYGLGDVVGGTATGRRSDYAMNHGCHEDTIKRREMRAIKLLVDLLLEGGPVVEDGSRHRGGYCNIQPDGNWMLCFRDLDGMWEWDHALGELAFHASSRLPAKLIIRNFWSLAEAYESGEGDTWIEAYEAGKMGTAFGTGYEMFLHLAKRIPLFPILSLEFERAGAPDARTFHSWPARIGGFTLRLQWSSVHYPPFVRLYVDGDERSFFFEDDLVMNLHLDDRWDELSVEWWWHHGK